MHAESSQQGRERLIAIVEVPHHFADLVTALLRLVGAEHAAMSMARLGACSLEQWS